jgi:hypothetical protein
MQPNQPPNRRRVRRLAAACAISSFLFSLAGVAQMQPSPPKSGTPEPDTSQSRTDTITSREVVFTAEEVDDGTQPIGRLQAETDPGAIAAKMKERLQDPQQRKLLWAEQRKTMQQSNPDLAEAVPLDATQESKLLDLLADRQMRHLERMYLLKPDVQNGPAFDEHVLADEHTRSVQELRELLGEETYHRYEDYRSTLPARQEANYMDKHFDPSNKLTPDQKARLIALLHEQFQEKRQRSMTSRVQQPAGPMDFSAEGMERANIEINEQLFREVQQDSRELLQRLPKVLTPAQLAVAARLEERKVASQRKHVQDMRVRAGMSPELSEQPLPENRAPPRKPVNGRIEVIISLIVNRSEPTEVTLQTENGKMISFAGPEGLFIEAIPTLYADGWLSVEEHFFEGTGKDRRLISQSHTGTRTNPQLNRALGGGGGILNGRNKGYSYRLMVNARLLP